MTWFVTTALAEDAAPQATMAAETPAATDAAHPAAPAQTSSEVGQAGGHEGAFPPFDTHHFPSQILWFIICFGALYILMKRVIVPRMSAIIDGRAQRIAGDIDEAQRLRTQSDTAVASYEAALATARGSAHKIAQDATDKAKLDADHRRSEIETELTSKLADAEARIGEIKSKALADVSAIAQEAASAVVSTLIGHEPSADEVAAAVSEARAK